MDVHRALHPTDQTLSSCGQGKLDDGWAAAIHAAIVGSESPRCRPIASSGASLALRRPRWL
jgi:hypothetical protein